MSVTTFSCRGARSPALFSAMIGIVTIETGVLHLWLRLSHPVIAWTLTALSVATLAWLVADFRSAAYAALRVEGSEISMAIGARFRMVVSRTTLVSAERASWQKVPEAGKPGYLNATAPADPNVLLSFDPPATVRLPLGLTRRVGVLGVCLDDPDAFLSHG